MAEIQRQQHRKVSALGRRLATCCAHRLNCRLTVVIVFIVVLPMAEIAAAAEPVVIAMRSQATVNDPIILLGDVSDIVTDDQRLQAALAQIDLAERSPGTDVVGITRRQVLSRLRIAGFSPDSFLLVGAQQVHVSGRTVSSVGPDPIDQPPFEQRVLSQVRADLAEHWDVPIDDLDVRLTKPLPTLEAHLPGQIDEIEVSFAPEQRPGAMRPRVYLRSHGQLLNVWNLPVEALLIADVVVAKTSVAAGDVLSDANVQVARRPIRQANQTLDLDRALGRAARRAMQPGQIVKAYDVREQPQQRNYAIRSRDIVQLIARKGSLLVTVSNAEAIHNANVGETIRVRNPSSKKIVVGRVVNSNQVQVLY